MSEQRFCGRRPGHRPHRWTTPAGVRDGKLVVLPDDYECNGYPPSDGDATPPAPSLVEGEPERHIHAWTDDDGRFHVDIDPHGGPCLHPERMPASSAVGETRVEWGVCWSAQSTWGYGESRRAAETAIRNNHPTWVASPMLVSRTVTTSAWVPVTDDKETDRA